MGIAKYIGRIGALAVALGVGIATAVPASAADAPPSDKTALLVCGTTCPTFDDATVELLMDQFITPTHQGQTITPVAVTTPEEYWPITGFLRLVELAIGDPRLGGLDGPAWPDEPLSKLSGLFDLTIDQSIRAGVTDLETSMTKYGNDHLVIYGYSQGAAVVVQEKRKLAEQYPVGTAAPDIEFVLGGDTNLPNGGLNSRFPGLYIPILDLTFNGPEPTDTPFRTDVITRQYDGAADFPLYPLNVVADLNAVLGFLYLHTHPFDVSLADETSAPIVSTDPSGKSSYYFFETRDLPLFAPLRTLGVPEPLIDVIEPFFRAVVDLGYDRSVAPWEPTPARLIPQLDPAKAAGDVVTAIGEGINNAAKLFGLAPPPHDPVPVTLAAPAAEVTEADVSPVVTTSTTSMRTRQMTRDDEDDDSNSGGDVDDGKIDATSELSDSDSTPDLAGSDSTPDLSGGDSTAELSADDSTTGTTASDPETTAESSSASGDSSQAANDSSANDSSGGDAGGSS